MIDLSYQVLSEKLFLLETTEIPKITKDLMDKKSKVITLRKNLNNLYNQLNAMHTLDKIVSLEIFQITKQQVVKIKELIVVSQDEVAAIKRLLNFKEIECDATRKLLKVLESQQEQEDKNRKVLDLDEYRRSKAKNK